jgi:hypothetical protein
MGTWGASTFDSDAALDFIHEQMDRYVSLVEEIFAGQIPHGGSRGRVKSRPGSDQPRS